MGFLVYYQGGDKLEKLNALTNLVFLLFLAFYFGTS